MQVTVHAIFSHNDKIGSKVICHGTHHLAKNEPLCSHTALLVNERWVHESTGHSGVRIISIDLWKTLNKEVARVPLKDMLYQDLANHFRSIKDKKYDYMGILFFCFAIIPTFIGFKLPKKNLLESPDKYFCCEVLGYLTGQYYGMSAPIQVMKLLLTERSNG